MMTRQHYFGFVLSSILLDVQPVSADFLKEIKQMFIVYIGVMLKWQKPRRTAITALSSAPLRALPHSSLLTNPHLFGDPLLSFPSIF
ncbi:hypothetical protein IV203_027043 [Nitzschia inconspicua]|uniref:Secreted protein n=1 Tax=Nitzschia inconspicua TaxID=303405 RepID=A0A9K3LKE0_9STRA|nr:hypothetical protein IV203_027043 [Nitzschia inconspicua]